jgi:hypothetical protein
VAASIYSRTLQKASELVGGHLKLCRHLEVPSSALADWINDKGTPPLGVFLRAVDLVLNEVPAPGSEPSDPTSARDASPASDSSTRS